MRSGPLCSLHFKRLAVAVAGTFSILLGLNCDKRDKEGIRVWIDHKYI